MGNNSITPDRVAHICDKIATIEDPEKRAARAGKEAKRLGVNEETINATFAHVKIRRTAAIARVRNIVNQRKRTNEMASEGQEVMAKKRIPGSRKIGTSIEEGAEKLEILRDGLRLLQGAETEQDVVAAIEKFAEAGDSAVLEVIADVYGTKRPDIAIEALLRADTPDAALALAVQHQRQGHRKTFNGLLGRIGEELS